MRVLVKQKREFEATKSPPNISTIQTTHTNMTLTENGKTNAYDFPSFVLVAF